VIRPVASLILVACLAFVVACSGDDKDEPGASPSTETPAASSTTVTATSATTPDATGDLPAIKLQRFAPSLSFARMTGMYAGPDGRFYVTEQAGRVIAFASAGSTELQSFLDISGRVSTDGNEEGLLGLAFAPDYAQSGAFYVYYAAKTGSRHTVLSRFHASNGVADPKSEQILLQIPQPFPNHKGGQLIFGPDGMLYLGLGDGGSGNDPMGNGQNRNVLLAKLLRIDVSKADAGLAYSIPADNPFAGQPNVRGEIWAYGLRNPWRFSFDSQTGQLWLADVGQDTREEVDIITKGGNYGWSTMEGLQCLSGTGCDRNGLTLPIIDYGHDGGECSITGGFVYRGQAIAALQGAYVYADYCSGKVWALRYDGTKVTQQSLIADAPFNISSFAVDAQGELYALQHADAGGIFKLVP
jgi:glucose/arabinose dehydrogenase